MRTGSQVTFAKPVILDYRFQWNHQPTGQIVGATDADDPLTTENDREAAPPAASAGTSNWRPSTSSTTSPQLGERRGRIQELPYYADREGDPVTTNFCEVRGAWTDAAFEDQKARLMSAVNGLGFQCRGTDGDRELGRCDVGGPRSRLHPARVRGLTNAAGVTGPTSRHPWSPRRPRT